MPGTPGERSDPFPAFRFIIALIDSSSTLSSESNGTSSIENSALGGFSECSGLEMSMEIHEYKEGGVNNYVHQFVTRANFSKITLKRGIVLSDDLWKWHYDYVQGKGKRKDGTIALMNEEGKRVKVWMFKRGIPSKWTGPSFNATQNGVAIETLEISHEGIELYVPQT
jgi:phage tail-like protein